MGQGPVSAGGKERLLRAAERLFLADAYERVSVSQILEAAGVRAPTLYHHFGDKENLFVCLAERAFARLGSAVSASLDACGNVEAALGRVCAALNGPHGFDMPQTLRDAATLDRPESRERVLRAYLEQLYEPLCAVLVSGMEKGVLRHEPLSRMAAVFLMGAMACGPHGDLPGHVVADDPGWWPRAFLDGFGRRG